MSQVTICLRLYAITSKELRQLARDRLTFGMIVGIPLMQIVLFGYAINFDVRGLQRPSSMKRTPVFPAHSSPTCRRPV